MMKEDIIDNLFNVLRKKDYSINDFRNFLIDFKYTCRCKGIIKIKSVLRRLSDLDFDLKVNLYALMIYIMFEYNIINTDNLEIINDLNTYELKSSLLLCYKNICIKNNLEILEFEDIDFDKKELEFRLFLEESLDFKH